MDIRNADSYFGYDHAMLLKEHIDNVPEIGHVNLISDAPGYQPCCLVQSLILSYLEWRQDIVERARKLSRGSLSWICVWIGREDCLRANFDVQYSFVFRAAFGIDGIVSRSLLAKWAAAN